MKWEATGKSYNIIYHNIIIIFNADEGPPADRRLSIPLAFETMYDGYAYLSSRNRIPADVLITFYYCYGGRVTLVIKIHNNNNIS